MEKGILISGASSPLGGQLLGLLSDRGSDIRLLVRRPGAWGGSTEPFVGDLRDGASLNGAGEGVESLFHLASFHPAPGDPDPEGSPEHHQVSVQGTRNLLAQLEGVRRIVFASSVRAGEASATAYGAAKREAEGLLGAFCEARGISLVIVRFPAFYGTPGLGGLATMADAVRRGRFPPIPEFGNRRAFIHVADAARALVAAWDSPQAAGKVLVATDGEAYSTRRIYLAMRASAGVPPPAITPPGWLFHAMAPAGDLAGRLLKRRFPFNREVLDKLAGSAWHDDQELRRLTNYRPHHNIEQALERGEI